MLRGAIIGFGNIAIQGHVPAWRRRHDVEIVAGTDARPAQRAALATHMPGARWYDSSDALLADAGLDFVDIATPPSSHAPLIRGALARRLHVLCEKPLVHSLDELGALRALAEEHGRVLHTVHNWHHAPIVRRTATLVREGAIGQVTRVDWHTLRTRPALSGGGYHPDWFDAVADEFLAEVAGQAPRGANLDEASLCVALESSARASSLAGGRGVALSEVSG